MPFGQSTGQGFVNPSILIAEILEIIGTKGRILVYDPTIALGNLVLAITGQTYTDPDGNIALPGLTVGNVNSGNYTYINLSGQIMLFNGGVDNIELDPVAQVVTLQGPAKIKLPTGDSMELIAANIESSVVGSGVTRFLQTLFSGPKGNVSGFEDWVQIQQNSSDFNGGVDASLQFIYVGTGGGIHGYAAMDASGFNIAAGTIIAAHPGSTPLVPESWQTLSLVNGYIAGANPGGFLDVPQLRMDADNNMVHFKGTIVTPNPVTSPIIASMPAGYPNANLGGNYGMGSVIMNHSGGTTNQLRIQNNGNISFQITPGVNFTFDITCQIPTQ